jgi:hypothetical protein
MRIRPPTQGEERVIRNIAGRCNGMTFDATTRLVEVQVSGWGGDPVASDPSLRPQTIPGMPVVFPFGFLSLLPTGDEYEVTVLETASGVIGVSMRNALPSGVPTPAEGDSIQYSSKGGYTHHDADGDTVVEPTDSNFIKLGAGATDFVALAQKVLTELGKIETAYNTHTHPTAPDGPVSPPSATYVKASVAADKAKAE